MLFSFSVILAIPKGFSGEGLVQQRLLQRLHRSVLPLLDAVDALAFAGGAILPRRPVKAFVEKDKAGMRGVFTLSSKKDHLLLLVLI
jgi:hypothetical protein